LTRVLDGENLPPAAASTGGPFGWWIQAAAAGEFSWPMSRQDTVRAGRDGRVGSGKTTIADTLALRLNWDFRGWRHISSASNPFPAKILKRPGPSP